MRRPAPLVAAAAALALVAGVGGGCHRAAAPPAAPAQSLAGLTLPLTPALALRLEVQGSVGAQPARVPLDLSRPLSTASAGCFPGGLPRAEGTARVPEPSGAFSEWELVTLADARVGTRSLGALKVGLSREKECVVALGQDVLAAYALAVDPLRREVHLSPSRPREAYAQEAAAPGEERHLLELQREPTTDWPLVAARLRTGEGRPLAGAFVLGTREPFSLLAAAPARAAGLSPVPEQVRQAFLADTVELAQGVAVGPVLLEAGPSWAHAGTVGRIGPDVWGRFQATLDFGGHTLLLRRPAQAEARTGCGAQGDEEGCYGLNVRREAHGQLSVTGVVWRELPRGGRLELEPTGEDPSLERSACRLGITFAPGGRGRSTQHVLPWPQLAQALPECADVLARAEGFTPSLFDADALSECPATCAYVRHLVTRRINCECQPTPLGRGALTAPSSRKPDTKTPAPREQEPADPE